MDHGAVDLFDSGVQLMRQNLRRRDPRADRQEIERQLRVWLRERPGAEHGDCPGRPVDIRARIGYHRGRQLQSLLDALLE